MYIVLQNNFGTKRKVKSDKGNVVKNRHNIF